MPVFIRLFLTLYTGRRGRGLPNKILVYTVQTRAAEKFLLRRLWLHMWQHGGVFWLQMIWNIARSSDSDAGFLRCYLWNGHQDIPEALFITSVSCVCVLTTNSCTAGSLCVFTLIFLALAMTFISSSDSRASCSSAYLFLFICLFDRRFFKKHTKNSKRKKIYYVAIHNNLNIYHVILWLFHPGGSC